jgi:3-hydroxybutyryl-CoA dehydratase
MSTRTDVDELRWGDLQKGMKRDFEVQLTSELLDQFANCSGDFSPIHMSSDEAKSRNFKGRVAHGMLLGAFLSRLVGCHLPGRFAVLLSSNFKFHQPCILGELVKVEGSIEDLSPSTRTITLAVRFLVDNNLRASATALVSVRA